MGRFRFFSWVGQNGFVPGVLVRPGEIFEPVVRRIGRCVMVRAAVRMVLKAPETHSRPGERALERDFGPGRSYP